jgi:DNA mismatch endonuclease (patch repair protein)
MADIFSPQKRSEVMSRIRSGNTKPEIRLRSMLHSMGFRFTINSVRNRKLPGRPDIIMPRLKTVIFVHGCFWHGHENCGDFKMPKSRQEYWVAKIGGNQARDGRVKVELEALGWRVLTIWACRLDTEARRAELSTELRDLLN